VPASVQRDLRKAQQAWSIFRDRQFAAAGQIYNLTGGTLGDIEFAQHRLGVIKARALQLGELVERLGSRLEDLEALLMSQTRRLESLESGSVRSWLETVPDLDPVEAREEPSAATELRCPPTPKTRQTASVRFQETTQLGLPPSMDSEYWSDAYSEDTTTTDITEEGYRPSLLMSNRRGAEQSYTHLQNQKYLEPPFEEESSRFGRAMMSKSKAFRPTEMELSAVYQYDGNNYAAMMQAMAQNPMLAQMLANEEAGLPVAAPLGAEAAAELSQRYASELTQMEMMGFVDRNANLEALRVCDGNVEQAINYLLSSA
jgi:ubiquilin